MTKYLEERLAKDFSFMKNTRSAYQFNYEDKESPIPCECNDGWYDILYELCSNIQKEIDKEPGAYIEVCQVKEKYGSLRFYCDIYASKEVAETIDNLINSAEEKSETVCEWCGAPGNLRSGGWIICLCDSCNEVENDEIIRK